MASLPDPVAGLVHVHAAGPGCVLARVHGELDARVAGALRRRLVAEVWLYPDDKRILELSTKCAPSEAFQIAAETRAYLAAQGVNLEGEQQTKTKTALEYFARQLRGDDPKGR